MTRRKIVPCSKLRLRDTLKKTFLPMLTDVFELRQMIESHTMRKSFIFTRKIDSPDEVLEKLNQMKQEVEESRRYCESVILQITRGIQEAKEVQEPKKKSLWRKLLLHR